MAADESAKAHEPGKRLWFVPDAYLPPPKPAEPLVNHEAVCLLNASKHDAHVTLTVYFEDREPIRDIRVSLPAERCLHLRLDKPEALGGAEIPVGVPYALRVESDTNIIVQHSRLDVTQNNLALFTSIAYSEE